MKHTQTITGELLLIERLPSSYYGNPRWLLTIGGQVCRTAVDANLAYGISNHDGKQVEATIGLHYGKMTVETVKAIQL